MKYRRDFKLYWSKLISIHHQMATLKTFIGRSLKLLIDRFWPIQGIQNREGFLSEPVAACDRNTQLNG
ncbi:hypothetical protein [Methylomonas sp. TEB]|uniref:hypothetical protein n=1 Tax=Methylomonas sp. TEB TaxID=3398229 RepID=UPI0039F5AB1B